MAASLVKVSLRDMRELYESHDRDFLIFAAEVVERTAHMKAEALREARARHG